MTSREFGEHHLLTPQGRARSEEALRTARRAAVRPRAKGSASRLGDAEVRGALLYQLREAPSVVITGKLGPVKNQIRRYLTLSTLLENAHESTATKRRWCRAVRVATFALGGESAFAAASLHGVKLAECMRHLRHWVGQAFDLNEMYQSGMACAADVVLMRLHLIDRRSEEEAMLGALEDATADMAEPRAVRYLFAHLLLRLRTGIFPMRHSEQIAAAGNGIKRATYFASASGPLVELCSQGGRERLIEHDCAHALDCAMFNWLNGKKPKRTPR